MPVNSVPEAGTALPPQYTIELKPTPSGTFWSAVKATMGDFYSVREMDAYLMADRQARAAVGDTIERPDCFGRGGLPERVHAGVFSSTTPACKTCRGAGRLVLAPAPSAPSEPPAAALVPLVAEQWRSIESAPQHGTILLWWKNAGACTGGFSIDEEWTPKSKTPREGWKGDEDEGIPRNQEDCTHWQLLRAPAGCKWPRFSDGHSTQEWFEQHYATPTLKAAEPAQGEVKPLSHEEIAAAGLGLEYVHSVLCWAACGYVHTPQRIAQLHTSYRIVDRIINAAAPVARALTPDEPVGWISVEDQLPELPLDEPVSLPVLTFHRGGWWRISRRYPKKWSGEYPGLPVNQVTHWMPLPAAPQGETK